jgi:hypothetical protein
VVRNSTFIGSIRLAVLGENGKFPVIFQHKGDLLLRVYIVCFSLFDTLKFNFWVFFCNGGLPILLNTAVLF